MSGVYTGQKGTLAGIPILFDEIEDNLPNAIIADEFPKRNGATLDHMGQKGRKITLRCFFYDNPTEGITYADHLKLIDESRSMELLEFEHPAYGAMQGFIESLELKHAEWENHVEISLTFLEDALDYETSVVIGDIEGHIEGTVTQSWIEERDELRRDTQVFLGGEGSSICDQILDPVNKMVGQITGMTSKALAYVSRVDACVSNVRATISSVATPANSLIATVSWAENLPGTVLKEIAGVCERYATLYEDLADSPESFIASYNSGIEALRESLGLDEEDEGSQRSKAQVSANAMIDKHITIVSATVCALYLAGFYSADQEDRRTVSRIEGLSAFDDEGRYIQPDPAPAIYNIRELEGSLGTVREMLQDAVNQARSMPSLKKISEALLDHVRGVKLEMDKIQRVNVDGATHLFLICHRYGLPVAAANRVLAINPFLDPNDVTGEVDVYVR